MPKLEDTGKHGYMAPEYIESGIILQNTDVFSFDVVLLELISCHKPVRYVQAEESGRRPKRIGLIKTLNNVLSGAGSNFTGRLRSWMDPRLKDSFP